MGDSTGIQWTDRTWSPWEGCTKVSPGCDRCYAASMNRWLQKGANWGPGAPRRLYGDEHWEKPGRWSARAARRGENYRVFPSVCDPFDNEVDDGLRMRFFRLVLDTPHLTWLLLTKRIGNVLKMVDAGMWEHLTNVWLGATVVNQDEADRDIDKLLEVPARVRFLSVEPMLGPVDLRLRDGAGPPDWVIVGGESGRGAREFDIAWPRSIVRQCKAAGVPVFVKQMGDNPVWRDEDDDSEPPHFGRITYIAKAGGEPAEWPEDLRVREFPK